MNQYDVVRVSALRPSRFAGQQPHYRRNPQVGDVGTILEVYGDAFEVECVDPETGDTLWVEAMFPDELERI